MDAPIAFARENGFTVQTSNSSHLVFIGYGAWLVAPAKTTDGRAGKNAIAAMRRAMRLAMPVEVEDEPATC